MQVDTQNDPEPTQPTQQNEQKELQRRKSDYPPGTWGLLAPEVPSFVLQTVAFDVPPLEKVTFGRKKSCNVVLEAKFISNVHCEIWRDANMKDVWLKDLSTNGTYVREHKVGRGISTIIKHGDLIKLGGSFTPTCLSFYWQDVDKNHIQRKPFCAGILDKYDFIERLGSGAFADVSRAVEKATREVRAVKHIRKTKFHTESKLSFEKEMKIQSEINHPNVVRLIEWFEDEDDLCLVLEYVDGGDLLNYVNQCGGLPEEDARKIAKMLFPAIAVFHQQKIVHRDLKPENILITHGDNPVVKIADFGLAKMVQEGSELRTTCGTPTWLAPEVLVKGFGPYTDKVDAWAMGLVIFACMINSLPFVENSDIDLTTRMESRVPNWDILPPGTSPECRDFLQRLCTQQVANRMSVTEACHHPWIRDSSNVQLLRSVDSEASLNLSQEWVVEILARNPSKTMPKPFIEEDFPGREVSPNDDDGVQVPVPSSSDSNVQLQALQDNSSLDFALNHFAPTQADAPKTAGLGTLMNGLDIHGDSVAPSVVPSSKGKRKARDMETYDDDATPQAKRPVRRIRKVVEKATSPPATRRSARKAASNDATPQPRNTRKRA